MRILICGLPGSGKTTLAEAMVLMRPRSAVVDGDTVRRVKNNTDFSMAGRRKQSHDVRTAADTLEALQYRWVIASYVAPTPELREIYDPEFTILMDTIVAGRFQDTNLLWTPPPRPQFTFHEWQDPERMAGIAWSAINGRIRLDQAHSGDDRPLSTVASWPPRTV